MRFPMSLSLDLGRYLFKKRLQGEEKFPLVLMLEPSHQCNLSCQGCGRIQEYQDTPAPHSLSGCVLGGSGGMRRPGGDHHRRRALDLSTHL